MQCSISKSGHCNRYTYDVINKSPEQTGSDEELRHVLDKGKESAKSTGEFLKSVGSYTSEKISNLFKK